MPTEVKFSVGMTCSGCEGAVKCVLSHCSVTRHPLSLAISPSCPSLSALPASRRILTKLDGVTAIETDVAAKSVTVTLADSATTTKEALLEALQKWGKAAGKEVALSAPV